MYILIGAVAFIAGVVITTLFVCLAVKRNNARRRRTRGRAASEPERKKMLEFSKIILGFVMLTYFIGLGFGIYAVNKILLDFPDYAIQALIALFGYVGTPTGVTIGFYSWKAKAENTLKIRKENPTETEGTTFDPSTIM